MSAPQKIVVFGATGAQGGSVVRTLIQSTKFSVRAITRDETSETAVALKEMGCEVVQADLDDKESLRSALHDTDAVYLCTNYFAYRSEEREYTQGVNALDVAKECGVDYVIYSGLENVKGVCGLSCPHFDGKSRVEKYLETVGLNYTVIRLSFFMENLMSVTPLQKYPDGSLGLSIPMGEARLYMISVAHIGPIICSILDNKEKYFGQVLGLSGDSLTVQEMADTMTQILGVKVHDAKTTLDHYCRLNFPECGELTAMFKYFQKETMDRDIVVSRMLNPELPTFAKWVALNKQIILDANT